MRVLQHVVGRRLLLAYRTVMGGTASDHGLLHRLAAFGTGLTVSAIHRQMSLKLPGLIEPIAVIAESRPPAFDSPGYYLLYRGMKTADLILV